MREMIYNNLYLTVDFQDVKAEDGTKTAQFYLVGTLPVLIDFKDGEKLVAKFKVPEPINSSDPDLRNMIGIKATDVKRRIYRPVIKNIITKFEQAFNKANTDKKWGEKEINNVSIIKLEYEEKSGETIRKNA